MTPLGRSPSVQGEFTKDSELTYTGLTQQSPATHLTRSRPQAAMGLQPEAVRDKGIFIITANAHRLHPPPTHMQLLV